MDSRKINKEHRNRRLSKKPLNDWLMIDDFASLSKQLQRGPLFPTFDNVLDSLGTMQQWTPGPMRAGDLTNSLLESQRPMLEADRTARAFREQLSYTQRWTAELIRNGDLADSLLKAMRPMLEADRTARAFTEQTSNTPNWSAWLIQDSALADALLKAQRPMLEADRTARALTEQLSNKQEWTAGLMHSGDMVESLLKAQRHFLNANQSGSFLEFVVSRQEAEIETTLSTTSEEATCVTEETSLVEELQQSILLTRGKVKNLGALFAELLLLTTSVQVAEHLDESVAELYREFLDYEELHEIACSTRITHINPISLRALYRSRLIDKIVFYLEIKAVGLYNQLMKER